MSLSDVSIKRPVFATMLNAVVIVFGIFGYSKIGIDQFPNIDFPVVVVQVVLPGADAKSVEQKILEPLERSLSGVAGLETMNSSAFNNLGQVVLQFKLERDGDKAAQDVRDKMARSAGDLPKEAEAPIIQKFDVGGAPIVSVAVSSNTISFGELSRIANDTIRPALEQVGGVGNVELVGNREREIHIDLMRPKLQAFGLSPLQIQDAVSSQITDIPSGRTEDRSNLVPIRTEGTLGTADAIAKLPISLPSGATIRIGDLANVKDTLAREESAASLNGVSTILLSVFKQSGGNTVAVAKGVHEKLNGLKSSLRDVNLQVVTDNSRYIEGLIKSVEFDLILGAILAILIVLFFLHDWRATIISALAIPTSVIGTLAVINYMGFSLNVMTTLGLTLSIGILVDDAIVVVENIYRHLTMGKTPMQAAKDGTNEIALAVFAITLAILAVFVPVAFMEGIIGRFFYSFGMTVASAVILSLFVAFTLTPMAASRILKSGHAGGHGAEEEMQVPKFFRPVIRFLNYIDHLYGRTLGLALRFRGITIGMGIGILILSGILLKYVPKTFFGTEDRGEFQVVLETPEGTSITTTKERVEQVRDFIAKYPGVTQTVTYIGSGAERKASLGTIAITMVDKEERTFSQDDMINRLRNDLKSQIHEGERYEVNAQQGGGGKSQPIQLVLKGDDYPKLHALAQGMREFVEKQVPETADVSTSEPIPSNQVRVITNPLLAADLGLSTAQIGTTLRNLFEGIKVGEILSSGLRYDVLLQADQAYRQTPSDLAGMTLPNKKGVQVDLSSVAAVEVVKEPSKIDRLGGQRQITVLSNFTGKDQGRAIAMIEQEVQKRMSPGLSYSFEGSSKFFKEAVTAIVGALILAILLVYMVLCAQFESYLVPFVIMMSVPLSFSGAFLGLLLTQKAMSIYAMIGLILLVGLVVKNAILLIDFTMQRIREGKGVNEALMEAGPIRLRPILMTTAAMIFGMVPIAIGHGTGGEARAPMAIAVIGGLISSTLLTLVVIPCIFSVLQGFSAKLATRRQGRKKKKKLVEDETVVPA